jgi:hypothetical protein
VKTAKKLKPVGVRPPIQGDSEWEHHKQDTQAQRKKPLRRHISEAQISYRRD